MESGTSRILWNGAIPAIVALAGAMIALPHHGASQKSNVTPPSQSSLTATYAKLPLSFEINTGQASPDVKFVTHGRGYELALTATGTTLAMNGPVSQGNGRKKRHELPPTVLRMALVGANPNSSVLGADKLPGTVSYCHGQDHKKWHEHIATYARVNYANVYKDIDLSYYGNQSQLEYDFIVRPGADPKTIQMAFSGSDGVTVDTNGDLVMATDWGDLRQHRPIIYQEVAGVRRSIPGRYVQSGTQQIGFQIDAYDKTKPLVIDPILSYSTFVSSSASDQGHGVAVDKDGNVWMVGSTYLHGTRDIMVAKLNAAGTAVLWSNVYGDQGIDEGNGVAVDNAGNAYVTGQYTFEDSMFPGQGIFDEQRLFVLKLSAIGDVVYFAAPQGSNEDVGTAITLDAAWDAYVTGSASGGHVRGFPIVNGIATYGGFGDAIVMVLNPAGTSILYSTYLGGAGVDKGYAITLDQQGYLYVAGGTGGMQVTNGAAQTQYGGSLGDAFVTKIDPGLSGTDSLVYSTYLGGGDYDQANGIAVDANGSAYVTGSTGSGLGGTPFPTTAGAYQSEWGGGDCDTDPRYFSACADVFVTKINPQGSAFVYSTYIGGLGGEMGTGIVVDANGNAIVTGNGVGFYPTVNGLQVYGGGTSDVILTKVNATGTGLIYSTYLGATGDDHGTGITRDAKGNLYVTGFSSSTSFPTTPGAFQSTGSGGGSDPFVLKINDGASLATAIASVSFAPSTITGAGNLTGTLTLNGIAPATNAVVQLTSSNPGVLYVPPTAQLNSGVTSRMFTAVARSVNAPTNVTVTATWGGVSKTTVVTVNPVIATAIASVAFAPSTITGAGNLTGTLTLDGAAPTANAVVQLTSSNPAALYVPGTAQINSGLTSRTFTAVARSVNAPTNVTVTATWGGVSKTTVVTINPVVATSIASVSFAPSTVKGGANLIGTLTLNGIAPATNAVVQITSSNAAVLYVPATAQINAGLTSRTFTAYSRTVIKSTQVTVTANWGGVSKTTVVTVNP